MAVPKPLPKDRIAASFKVLNLVSADLNESVRNLGTSIGSLEEALKDLNLGVSAWHQIAGNVDSNGSYWSRDIGYTQVGNDWCIALRVTHGNEHFDSHEENVWRFIAAPRWICVEAAGKLPDLFETLIKRAEEATQKIKARLPEIEELAGTVRGIREEIEAAKPRKAKKSA